MNIILNILWLIFFGGFISSLLWFLAGFVLAITVIGLPWARSCFVISRLTLWPFGKDIANREWINGQSDMGTRTLGFIGNIVWFIVAGIWLALAHLLAAIVCFLTIIGIPFGLQHIKLLELTLMPIGQTVVDKNRFK